MSQLKLVFISASVASGLTFIVTRFGGFLDRIKKRNVLNYNALIKFEILANVWGGILNDNRQNLETIMQAKDKLFVLPLNRLAEVPPHANIKLDLQDLSLINRLFDVEDTIRRLNDDAAIINGHLDSFQTGIIAKSLTPQEYSTLLSSMMGQTASMKEFIVEFLDELAELVAHVRVREKIDETISIKLLKKISTLRKRQVSSKEILVEKKKFLKEVEKNMIQSIKKKENIMAKVNLVEKNISDKND